MAARRRARASAPATAPSGPTHRVRRPFCASGVNYVNGDLVDASGWRRTEALVSARYLTVIQPGTAPAGKEDGDADPIQ